MHRALKHPDTTPFWADLAPFPDRDDAERPLFLGCVDEVADECAIALLEDVQRQQQTREQHRPEREQGQPRHARSLGRRRGDGHARFAGVGATVIRACLGELEAYGWCLPTCARSECGVFHDHEGSCRERC